MTRALGPQNVFMDRFVLEPKIQRVWRVPHATWFTLMGVGGGLFIVGRLLGMELKLGLWFGLPVADLLSFLAIAVGGLILIADLGRPLRFIRAVLNPRTSWISRGAIADFVFLGVGGLLVLPNLKLGSSHPFSWLPWEAQATSGAGRTLEIIGMIAAAVVMFYAGQVLAGPRSIPYWHSPAIPIQFVLSSLATSTALITFLEVLKDQPVTRGQLGILGALLLLLLGSIGWHLATKRDVPGKSHSLERLVKGAQRNAFLGGVVGAGTVVPLVLAIIGLVVVGARDAVGVVSFWLTLVAGFGLRLVTLQVGIYPPMKAIPAPVPVR